MGGMFSSKKPQQAAPIDPPKVVDPKTKKGRELANVGRASAIHTSPQGVLGNAKTGRKQLSV